MKNVIEIKASNKEKAIERAKKILEITTNQIVQVTEIQAPKSFLGLFAKEGIYKIESNKEINISSSSEDCENKTEISKTEFNEIKQEEIENTVNNLLSKMDLNLQIEELKKDGKYCHINLSGPDNGVLIGRKGKSLNSFEYLINTLIRGIKIEIDVEGFKEKRTETLKELAKKMAEKAIATGKIVKLNPMPPKERRIVHEIINQYPELNTYSEGRDPKRYIVIRKKR